MKKFLLSLIILGSMANQTFCAIIPRLVKGSVILCGANILPLIKLEYDDPSGEFHFQEKDILLLTYPMLPPFMQSKLREEFQLKQNEFEKNPNDPIEISIEMEENEKSVFLDTFFSSACHIPSRRCSVGLIASMIPVLGAIPAMILAICNYQEARAVRDYINNPNSELAVSRKEEINRLRAHRPF